MTQTNKSATESLSVSRVVQAPCEKVFRAWTDPRQLAQWFGPDELPCPKVEADIKVGGAFRIHLASTKGAYFAVGIYQQIVPNKRLQMTFEWEHYRMPESVLTIDFESLDATTTRVTLTHSGLPGKEDASDHTKGWTTTLEKFACMMAQNKIN